MASIFLNLFTTKIEHQCVPYCSIDSNKLTCITKQLIIILLLVCCKLTCVFSHKSFSVAAVMAARLLHQRAPCSPGRPLALTTSNFTSALAVVQKVHQTGSGGLLRLLGVGEFLVFPFSLYIIYDTMDIEPRLLCSGHRGDDPLV